MIRVLYVDDEPELLNLGKIFLEEEGGFVVDTSPSAEEALTFIHTHQYDAIISDFQMPDMDGIDFLRVIRAQAASLPVLLFTGKGREDVVIDAINNGADYYIEKGGDPAAKFSELRQKIEVAVERRRAGDKIIHYNRLYAIMSGINAAVLHTRSRDDLLARICHILLDEGKFERAWIGILNADRTRLLPAACCGYGECRLSPVDVAADSGPAPEGLSGRAAFTRRRAVALDSAYRGGAGNMQGEHSKTCTSAAFPVWFHNAIIGTIQIFEKDQSFFGNDELNLLEEICTDISFALATIEAEEQREKTRSALMESEEKFRILVEESLVGVYIIRDDRFLHVNPKFAQIMGHTQDDIVKTLHVGDLIEPVSKNLVLSEINRLMTGEKKNFHLTFQGMRKDGTIIDLEASGTAANYLGAPICLGTIIDITERRRAELERAQKLDELSVANRKIRAAEERLWAHIAALTESQERLNESEQRMTDIINFLPDAMFAIDTEGRVLVWNRAIERMTGIPAEDIIGRDDHEYALPFYNERRPVLADLVLNFDNTIAGRYDSLVRNGETLTAQVSLPHFRGNHGMHAWFTAAPLYDTRGKITGAIETIRDITEFEEARRALQQGRDRYEGIINNNREGVIITRHGHIVFTNPFIRSILAGYTQEELSGKAIADIIHPADRDSVQIMSDAQFTTTPGPEAQRVRGIARDGSYLSLECRSVLIEWEGSPASAWFISEIQNSPDDARAPLSRALF